MRKRTIALLGSLAMALTLFLPAGQAGHDPNGAHASDPANDTMSLLYSNSRNNYAREDPIHYKGTLDITDTSLNTSEENGEKFITFRVATNSRMPKPGADAFGPEGFETGVSSITVYFTWAMNQNQAGNAMTAPQPTGLVCGDAYTEQKLGGNTIARIDYNEHNDSGNFNGCRFSTQGPWHPTDGWNFTILLFVDADPSGKIAYTWSWGRYDAIEDITWTRPGSNHDRVECASLNPIAITCGEPTYGTGPGEVLHNTPATLNGANYYKDGTLRTNPGISAWPHGFANNVVQLKLPYLMRDDFANDNNGKADEMRNNTLMLSGDQVTGITTLIGGSVSVNIPPGECIAYGEILYGINPIFHDSDIVTRDECFSYSAGFTFTSDWAPGNPFVNTSAALPGVPGAWGNVCIGTSCQPNWGGRIINDGLGVNPYTPGLASPFCRYPVGLLFGLGSVPGGLTTRTVDDPLGGGSISVLGQGVGQYPAVPGATNPDGGDPGVTVSLAPLGSNNPCGHNRDPHATNWIYIGTGTAFTAR